MSQAQTLPVYRVSNEPVGASFIPGIEEEEEVIVEFKDVLEEFEESVP